MIICSLAISLGTIVGGKRIIKSVGMDMVSSKSTKRSRQLLYHFHATVRQPYRHARFHRPLQHLGHHGRRCQQIVQAR